MAGAWCRPAIPVALHGLMGKRSEKMHVEVETAHAAMPSN